MAFDSKTKQSILSNVQEVRDRLTNNILNKFWESDADDRVRDLIRDELDDVLNQLKRAYRSL